MFLKKIGGKIYGADLTAAERKGMDIEIQKELKKYDTEHSREYDAIILWVLHTKFGFGKKRLKEFYTAFGEELTALLKRYELDPEDELWLCTKKLKDAGIDLKKMEQ